MKNEISIGLILIFSVFVENSLSTDSQVSLCSRWTDDLKATRPSGSPVVLGEDAVCGKHVSQPSWGKIELYHDKSKDKDNKICKFILQAPSPKLRVHIMEIVGHLQDQSYDPVESMGYYQHPTSSVELYHTVNGGWEKLKFNNNSDLARFNVDLRYRDEGNQLHTLSRDQYMLVEVTFREYASFAKQKISITYEFYEASKYPSLGVSSG